jgi:hypothetical protein
MHSGQDFRHGDEQAGSDLAGSDSLPRRAREGGAVMSANITLPGFTPHGEVAITGSEAAVKFVLDTLSERESIREALETVGYSLPELTQKPFISAREICSHYPNFDLAARTADGSAFEHPTEDGGRIFVTTPGDAAAPDEADMHVRVARYARDGDIVGPEEGDVIAVADLEDWIDRQLGFGPKLQ